MLRTLLGGAALVAAGRKLLSAIAVKPDPVAELEHHWGTGLDGQLAIEYAQKHQTRDAYTAYIERCRAILANGGEYLENGFFVPLWPDEEREMRRRVAAHDGGYYYVQWPVPMQCCAMCGMAHRNKPEQRFGFESLCDEHTKLMSNPAYAASVQRCAHCKKVIGQGAALDITLTKHWLCGEVSNGKLDGLLTWKPYRT